MTPGYTLECVPESVCAFPSASAEGRVRIKPHETARTEKDEEEEEDEDGAMSSAWW